MSRTHAIRRAGTGEIVLARATPADTFLKRWRGLMLRRRLAEDEGLLFTFRRESRGETAIHMFFVSFPIAAVWLDGQGVVVDAKLAKPWRPYYAPARPARYLIEAPPSLLERVTVGERLTFDGLA
jgi:uncharacterized membrane protein (UPF0127 family)